MKSYAFKVLGKKKFIERLEIALNLPPERRFAATASKIFCGENYKKH